MGTSAAVPQLQPRRPIRMTQRPSLERFGHALQLAATLPHPTTIYRAILAGTREVDDGMRGTAYDGDRTIGGTGSSHPERMLQRRHPDQFPPDDDPDRRGQWGQRTDRARDDMLALRRATDRVLDAIATLNAVCLDAGQPDTWDQAIADANVLLEAGYLQAAIDVGRNVDSEALRFVFAVDTVRAVRDSWMAHAPAQGLAETNHPWCRSHKQIGVDKARDTRMLCRWCYRHVEDIAGFVTDEHGHGSSAVELQHDPSYWPSKAMLAAHDEGRRVVYDREHQAWLRSHGLDPLRVHQQRQGRRSA